MERPSKPAVLTPANESTLLGGQHKKSGTVPPYACWDNVLLVGKVLKEVPVSKTDDVMKKCSAECHKLKTCTHFEHKDGKCVLKDRGTAFVEKNLRNLRTKGLFNECGTNVKCADGYDSGRKTCLDSVMFQLDTKRTVDGKTTTNRQGVQTLVDVIMDTHKQTNKPKIWNILSIVFTVASMLLSPLAAFTGPLVGATGAVNLTTASVIGADVVATAIDAGTSTYWSVKQVKDQARYTKALNTWAKNPNDVPTFFYHNMPQEDGNKLVWGYNCYNQAKLRAELCGQNSDTGIPWNDQLDVHYLKPNDKRTSVCCQPRRDAGESLGNCDDMYDPSDKGACDFNSKEWKHASDSSKRLIKSAKWQNLPEAPHNYSNTLLSFALKNGGLIA